MTSTSTQYGLGWNLISLTYTGSVVKLRGSVNFGSLATFTQTTTLNYTTSLIDAVLGAWREGTTLSNSPNGIVHTMWIKDYDMTDSELSTYIAPRSGWTNICDYYIGMYNDLTSTASALSNAVELLGTSMGITMSYNGGITYGVNGAYFNNLKLEMKNRNISDIWAITFQITFTGTVIDQGSATSSNYFMNFHSGGGERPAYMVRNGGDIVYSSVDYSGSQSTLSGVFTNTNSNPMIISLGMGWLGDTNYKEHAIWAYFYQQGNMEKSGWMFTDSSNYTGTQFQPDITWKIQIDHIIGYVSEIYVLEYLRFPYLTGMQSTFSKSSRHTWYENSTFYTEPGYIWDGCGNGVTLASETGLTCDYITATTGCFSNCTTANAYTCTENAIGLSVWTTTWADNALTTATGEECDDGNNANGDGCSEYWEIETGYSCTNIENAHSTCTPIWGDGLLFGSESWDDDDNDNTVGWNSTCNGQLDGYSWTGGDTSSPTTCTSICGDLFITPDEECNDQNLDDGDGCNSTCKIETGWTCADDMTASLSTWIPICGDGLKFGSEVWDDGNSLDSIGCLSDCSGTLLGYTCSGGDNTTADVWTTEWGDGVRMPSEDWDDGNTVNGDGWSDTWTIEGTYAWNDNMLLTSIWVPAWSNGNNDVE